MCAGLEKITGAYKVCGVIGEPITHTLSPRIHNQLSESIGMEGVYVPFLVRPKDLEKAIEGAYRLGIQGLNITMPHKQSIRPYLYEIDEWAEKVGAVNTLVYTPFGYKGYNTDVYGVYKALEALGCDYRNRNVAIIGSGGAAYAAAICVIESVKALYIMNRTQEKAIALKKHLERYSQTPIYICSMEEQDLPPMDLVIQSTGVGMGDQKDQIPVGARSLLKHASYAMDMIYRPWETPFLKLAKEWGLQTINGWSMLFYQAVRAYELMYDLSYSEEGAKKVKEEIEKSMETE